MGLLNELQSAITKAVGQQVQTEETQMPVGEKQVQAGQGKFGPDLGDLLGPGLIGGLVGALMPGKGTAVKAGSASALAAMLWGKYKDKILPMAKSILSSSHSSPAAEAVEASGAALGNPAAARFIRAMVFAAKSDGEVSPEEQEAISQRLKDLGAGPEAEKIIKEALSEPLDPQKIAADVSSPQEALALFMASSAVIKADSFMENSYLDSLAKLLGIPEEMKKEVAEAGTAPV